MCLPIVGFIHEVITFGYGWGVLTGERDRHLLNGYLTVPSMTLFQLIGGVIDGVVLGILTVVFWGTWACVWVLSFAFVGLYFLAGNGTAVNYRVEFGATWQFPEPFWELLFHPVLTPALLVVGLWVFLALTRAAWWVRRHDTVT